MTSDEYQNHIKTIHEDYRHKRVYSAKDYIDLVRVLAVKFGFPKPLKESPGGTFFLRHDVDRDIINAVLMAQFEAEQGIKSSYYFLHTSAYYQGRVFDEIQKIADLGHEIGLHNDVLSVVYKAKDQDPLAAKRILTGVLTNLKLNFDVVGTAAHGDTEIYKKTKESNYNIFVDPKYDCKMSDFGLKYEAYKIPRDYYISDSGGKFSCSFGEGFEETAGVFTIKSEIDRVKRMSFKRPGVLQLLVHPLYYEFEK